MSRSPEPSSTPGEVFAYDSAWAALNQMVREGKPFSGHERNCAFLNLGPASPEFANVSSASGLDFDDDGRGLATCDWDFDGDVDFIVSNRTGPRVRLLRNDAPAPGPPRWVMLQLQGTRSNRDAVGARAEVYLPGGAVRSKTLAAGHSHLSQSSKWLHFGTGDAGAIERVVVRWPGGAAEEFTGVAPGRRWRLVEGAGPSAEPAPPPAGLVPLAAGPGEGVPESDGGRIVLLEPAPVPPLDAVDLDGQPISMDEPGSPLLLNLWATWCAPCAVEMAEWRDAREELEAAGLQIVSVAVDDPPGEGADDLANLVGGFIERLRYPYQVGLPAEGLLDNLDTLQRAFIGRQADLPVPSSFLLSRDRKLAVIYRGPVPVEQLRRDMDLLGAEPDAILAAATPLDGTWIDRPTPSPMKNVAATAVHKGQLRAAVRYADHVFARATREPGLVDEDDRLNLHRIRAAALFDLGEFAPSLTSWDEVLKLAPGHWETQLDRARALVALGRTDDAAVAYAAMLEQRRTDPEVLTALAKLRAGAGDHAAAVSLFDEALAAHGVAGREDRFDYATSLAATGRVAAAKRVLEEVLADQPGWPPAANNLAWILATAPDASLRDPTEALRLAKSAHEAGGKRVPSASGTLAAAYAANGQFDLAVASAEEAIALAKRSGLSPGHGLERFSAPLDHYRRGDAYLDPSLEAADLAPDSGRD